MDAHLSGRPTDAYACLSSSDTSTISLAEYSDRQDGIADVPFAGFMMQHVTFDIASLVVEGDSAEAEVAISMPDPGEVFGDLLAAPLAWVFGDEDAIREAEARLNEKYAEGDVPMTTTTDVYHLVRENGTWRVHLDLATAAQVSAMLEEARELEESHLLREAKEKYQDVVGLDPDAEEALSKIDELAREIPLWEERRAYIEMVTLRDVKVGQTTLREPGVFGEIKNGGDRTLARVELTIYCLDEGGQPVYEERHTPVTALSIWDNSSLKPNYSRKFGYDLEDAPSDWAGEVRVEVTDIEFED